VGWAKNHSTLLVKDLVTSVERWIKEACDEQPLPAPDRIQADWDEIVFWRTWRAPKLIYMQPAGNAPYVPAKAWHREDEAKTTELLRARSKRFVEFLELTVEKIAGKAHVIVAQDAQHSKRISSDVRTPQPETEQTPTFQTEKRAHEKPESTPDKGLADAAIRQAIVRKVQDPHSYTFLTVPEAAVYFGVRPRTIYRWLNDGKLRDGGRRGAITTESVRIREKKRSRKRRNRNLELS
jgi:hypothetical protein